MITKMPQSSETVLAVQASGQLTHEDYENVFIPELNQAIEQNGSARVVIFMDATFEGWELQAAWDDAKFGIAHRNDFAKLAIVGGPRWVAWSAKLSEAFISGEIKMFELEQLAEAFEWVKE